MNRSRRLARSLPTLVVLAIAVATGLADAQLKRAYFSNTPTSGGIRYGRSDFEAMPAEVTTFDLEKDKDVFFYVILDTAEPVKVSGVLKDPNGRQHAKFDRDVERYGRPVHQPDLLAVGQLAMVDGAHAGQARAMAPGADGERQARGIARLHAQVAGASSPRAG